jgi:hypothetical protein
MKNKNTRESKHCCLQELFESGDWDIRHIEDDKDHQRHVEGIAISNSWDYQGMLDLNSLKTALQTGEKGRVYVVDGEFARDYGGMIEWLAGEAIEEIQRYDPDGHIILFSGAMEASRRAEEYGVDCLEKGRNGSKDLRAKLLELLG